MPALAQELSYRLPQLRLLLGQEVLTPIFAPASQPLADWTVSCGKALQVAAVQALCAEGWLLMTWIWGR
jgi:hypothetical protein